MPVFVRHALVLCLLTAMAAALPVSVAAGPVERLYQMSFHPKDPARMIVSYENGAGGLLFSEDGGRTFKLVCTSMIQPLLKNVGRIAITGDGHVLMAMYEGMFQADSRGCQWGLAPTFDGRWANDVSIDPINPTIAYAVTSNGNGAKNGLLKRAADGEWADIGPREEILYTRMLIVKRGEGRRFYLSALRLAATPDGGPSDVNPLIRISDDEGATWREFPVMAAGRGVALSVEAADPQNPERILAWADGAGKPGKLMISQNAGETFTEYLPLTQLGGLALAPDGRVWIGESASISDSSASRGLWFAENLDTAPQKIGDYGVECLGYQPKDDTLFVCQAYGIGTADPKSGEFTDRGKFSTVRDFVSCEGVDASEVCRLQLCKEYCGAGHFAHAPMCCAYAGDPLCGPQVAESEGTAKGAQCSGNPAADGGTPEQRDAGEPDAATTPMSDAGTAPLASSRRKSGGCSSIPAHSPSLWPAALVVLGVLWLSSRRRARSNRA